MKGESPSNPWLHAPPRGQHCRHFSRGGGCPSRYSHIRKHAFSRTNCSNLYILSGFFPSLLIKAVAVELRILSL